ncbi:FirrV-1-B47 [Feldmannia irregularis virus a]|uniref:FirrV-1-B47 n=1 Tax=Feldmannia irregularis virus a TaxID=231992 RepID=Q6XLY9_9PHYC|nr:FirrV-1-B47 [Feldmannia irregularis virus a]AAR26922.1 FirrV-1-B47 [Feldmannia irregularis virus a]
MSSRAVVPYSSRSTALVPSRKRKAAPKRKPAVSKKVVKKVVRKRTCPRNQRLMDDGTCASDIPCFDDDGNPTPWMERDEYGNCQIRKFGKDRILDPDTLLPISVDSPRGKFLVLQKKYDDAKKYVDRYETTMAAHGPENVQLSYKDAFSRKTQVEKQKQMIELHKARLQRIKDEKEKDFNRNAIDPKFFHAMRGWQM